MHSPRRPPLRFPFSRLLAGFFLPLLLVATAFAAEEKILETGDVAALKRIPENDLALLRGKVESVDLIELSWVSRLRFSGGGVAVHVAPRAEEGRVDWDPERLIGKEIWIAARRGSTSARGKSEGEEVTFRIERLLQIAESEADLERLKRWKEKPEHVPAPDLPPLKLARENPSVNVLSIPETLLGSRPSLRVWTLKPPLNPGRNVMERSRVDDALGWVAWRNHLDDGGMDVRAEGEPAAPQSDGSEDYGEALLLALQAVEGYALPEDLAVGAARLRNGKITCLPEMSAVPMLADETLTGRLRFLLTATEALPEMEDLRAEGKEKVLHRVMIFETRDRRRTRLLARALAKGDATLKGLREAQDLIGKNGVSWLANPHVRTRLTAAVEAWPECATARFYLNWKKAPAAAFSESGTGARVAHLYHRVREAAGYHAPFKTAEAKKEMTAAERQLGAWLPKIPGGKNHPKVKALNACFAALRKEMAAEEKRKPGELTFDAGLLLAMNELSSLYPPQRTGMDQRIIW